jgi:hypothetical protein
MPKNVLQFKILIASPTDVKQERDSVDAVISELNRTYGDRLNVVISIVKWETHSAPSVGENSSQDVIDGDFRDDYDIFIGLFWKKYGTPVMGSESGTAHEFKNAYKRFQKSPKSLKIMFYFKNSGTEFLSEINPEDLSKIYKFKTELEEKHILYWEFSTLENFNYQLRSHIPMRLDELLSEQTTNEELKTKTSNSVYLAEINEEFGVVDYDEKVSKNFDDATKAIIAILSAMSCVGIELTTKANEIPILVKRRTFKSREDIRLFLISIADSINKFSDKLEEHFPNFFSSFRDGTISLLDLILIFKYDKRWNKEVEISDYIVMLSDILESIHLSVSEFKMLIGVVSGLPNISKELNIPKKRLVEVLYKCLEQLELCENISEDIINKINKKNVC